MLLKLLVKLIIVSLGLYLLNTMFYFELKYYISEGFGGIEAGYLPVKTSEFILNILSFKQINSWFAFSYILSILGFVAFVIYDYYDIESVLHWIKRDLFIVVATLVGIQILLLLIGFIIMVVFVAYKFFIFYPYEAGWGIFLNNSEIAATYEMMHNEDYTFNYPAYIIAILVNIFLLYCLSYYKKLPHFIGKQNKRIDKFSILMFSILPIYFVFTFPTILVWLYPTLLLIIENKSLPNTYILYLVLYSVGLIFIFYKTYKRIKKNRLSKLKAEIKEEVMQELREQS